MVTSKAQLVTLHLLRCVESLLGTFGMIVSEDGVPLVLTLELPWRDNARQISCIARGIYRARRHPRGYEIPDVPDRSGILIHTGNTVDDIRGCILVGMSIGVLNGKPAVLKSSEALNRLIQSGGDAFILDVRGPRFLYDTHH